MIHRKPLAPAWYEAGAQETAAGITPLGNSGGYEAALSPGSEPSTDKRSRDVLNKFPRFFESVFFSHL